MSPFCCISFFKCSTLRPSITRHWQSNRAQSDYKHLLTFRVRAMLSQQCNLCTTRVSRYQKKHSPTHHPDCTFSNHYLLDFNGAGEDNRGRYTDNPAGRHPLRTNQWATSINPPIFTPDALPATTLPIYPGSGQAQKYAGLHTPWLC